MLGSQIIFKVRRTIMGLTLVKLAEKMGIHHGCVWRYETEPWKLSLKTATSIESSMEAIWIDYLVARNLEPDVVNKALYDLAESLSPLSPEEEALMIADTASHNLSGLIDE